MNRKWLTGLTLAGVAGTGGAAFATVAQPTAKPSLTPTSVGQTVAQAPVVTEATVPASTASAETAAATTDAPTPQRRTITYQIGDVASMTLDIDGAQLSVREIEPREGWSVGAISTTGAHIDVQFTDTTRIVGVVIDLIGGQPVVSVTNSLAPGATGPVGTDPVTVSSTDGASAPSNPPLAAVPPTVPETPDPTTAPTSAPMAPVTAPAPAPPAPSPAATTTTSAVVSGEGDDSGEHEDDSAEHEDHEHDGGESDD